MISRRTLLGGIGLGAATLGLSGAALASGRNATAVSPTAAGAPAGSLPLTITNNSGAFGNSAVRVYIVGTNLETGEQSYVKPDGSLAAVAISDNVDDGFTDYSIPLDSGDTRLALPAMSGRIYFALQDKLRFRAVTGGDGATALQYPAGWVESDPNFSVLHDCVEFTHNGSGMFCNTTMVDQFSVPLSIRLTGAADQTTGTLSAGGRDAIINALAADPDHSPLVVGDGMRVIAPGHGIDSGLFSDTYFDPYIDQVWNRYRDTPLTITTNAGTFTGQVDGAGVLNFDGGVTPIPKPSTRDVFFCDGALAAPNDEITGPVAAILGAALNRSTLLDSAEQPTADPAGFYRTDVTNHYAKTMHANTEDGTAYGFAFDDVAGFASYIQDHAPTGFAVTLTPF